MLSGTDVTTQSTDARIANITASVAAGKLVIAMSHDGSFVVDKDSPHARPSAIRYNIATGCRYIQRDGHERVPMDSISLYNLLGATLLLPGGEQVKCDGFSAACKGFPDMVQAGGAAYTAKELCDKQVQARPFGSRPDASYLPCWKVVLEAGRDL